MLWRKQSHWVFSNDFYSFCLRWISTRWRKNEKNKWRFKSFFFCSFRRSFSEGIFLISDLKYFCWEYFYEIFKILDHRQFESEWSSKIRMFSRIKMRKVFFADRDANLIKLNNDKKCCSFDPQISWCYHLLRDFFFECYISNVERWFILFRKNVI